MPTRHRTARRSRAIALVDRRHPDLTSNTTDRAPRLPRSARNDTRALLRSRPLQAVLLAVAAAQVVAVGSGKALHSDQPRTLLELTSRVASSQPLGRVAAITVAAPVKAAKAAVSSARKSAA